jgi:hypothetical protein
MSDRVLNDAALLAAFRELGDCLSAMVVPSGVIATFPSLSDLQTKFFTTVLYPDSTAGAGQRTASCVLRQPNGFLPVDLDPAADIGVKPDQVVNGGVFRVGFELVWHGEVRLIFRIVGTDRGALSF